MVHFTEVDGKEVVIRKDLIEKPNDLAIYQAKRREDIMRDIEIKQQELATLDTEIVSWDEVAEIKVGTKTMNEVILETQ